MASSDAELALSEITTNAVVHGSGEVRVALSHLDGVVHIEVHDEGGPGRVVHRHTNLDQPGGHGLEVIGRLSTTWGWSQTDDTGTTVWAEVPRTPLMPAGPERSLPLRHQQRSGRRAWDTSRLGGT